MGCFNDCGPGRAKTGIRVLVAENSMYDFSFFICRNVNSEKRAEIREEIQVFKEGGGFDRAERITGRLQG